MRAVTQFLVWLSLLSLLACSDTDQPQRPTSRDRPPTPVVLETIQWQAETVRFEAVGTARALRSITLYPETEGQVTQVGFRAGEKVQEGQVLLQLEQRDEQIAVQLAEVRLEDAQRLYRRYQRAEGSNAFAPTVVDEARTEAALRRLELQQAQVALAERTVNAPFSGHIGISDIDPGDRITPSTAIATLDDRSRLQIRFAVPEALSNRLQLGQDVNVSGWHTRQSLSATVIDIDNQINSATRTFIAHAELDNPNDQLRPGMSFRVQAIFQGEQYPSVPEIAVQWGGDGAYLWAVEAGEVRSIPVNIVQRQPGRILVQADLAVDTQVVIEGLQRMRDGLKIIEFDPAQLGQSE